MSSQRPVILAAFANDRVEQVRYLRNLPEEARRLKSALTSVEKLCELVVLSNATLDEILDAFQKYRGRIVIFHYGGHANGYQLLLETANGEAKAAGAAGIARFLGGQLGLQLVFLNGCSTEQQTDGLRRAGVPAVIATTQSIDDGVATQFSARFYQGLASGVSIGSAYEEAVGAVQAESGGETHRLLIPVEGQFEEPQAERWPWFLRFRQGSERTAAWSLPEAAGDPLFGLPPLPALDLPEKPFRHLYRFESEHAPIFFGRGHEIRDMYQQVTACDGPPVLLFYGPSGVGKSSLLDAGLIPRLQGRAEVCYLRRDQQLGLTGTLKSAFPADTAAKSPRVAWKTKEEQSQKPFVMILDQIEEAFTKPQPNVQDELQRLAICIKAIFGDPARRPQGRLILAFRKEWFAEIEEQLAQVRVPFAREYLDRLERRSIVEAIRGPTQEERLQRKYHLQVEAGLPEIIAENLLSDRDSPVAPTLQIVLTRMWEEAVRRSPQEPTFDKQLYYDLQLEGKLLEDFLQQQIQRVHKSLPAAVSSGFLLDLLAFHTTELGTAAEHSFQQLTQNYAQQTTDQLMANTLQQCQEAYLLTVTGKLNASEGGKTRLVHDTLAPLVRKLHAESNLPGQRARRILDNRMVDWRNGKTGAPLDDMDLNVVEQGQRGTRSWTPDEQRLIDTSRDLRERWRQRMRLWAQLGALALLVICFTGMVAARQWHLAEKAVKVAEDSKRNADDERKKAVIAAQHATQAQREASHELVRSELVYAHEATQQQDPFRAAHHFAAAIDGATSGIATTSVSDSSHSDSQPGTSLSRDATIDSLIRMQGRSQTALELALTGIELKATWEDDPGLRDLWQQPNGTYVTQSLRSVQLLGSERGQNPLRYSTLVATRSAGEANVVRTADNSSTPLALVSQFQQHVIDDSSVRVVRCGTAPRVAVETPAGIFLVDLAPSIDQTAHRGGRQSAPASRFQRPQIVRRANARFQFSSDGNSVISFGPGGVSLWNTVSGHSEPLPDQLAQTPVTNCVVGGNPAQLVLVAWETESRQITHWRRCQQPDNAELIWEAPRALTELPELPGIHQMLPSGRMVLLGTDGQGVIISASGQTESVLQPPTPSAEQALATAASKMSATSMNMVAVEIPLPQSTPGVLVVALQNAASDRALLHRWYLDSRATATAAIVPRTVSASDNTQQTSYADIQLHASGLIIGIASDGCYCASHELGDTFPFLKFPCESVPNVSVSADGKRLLLWIAAAAVATQRGGLQPDSARVFDVHTGVPLTPPLRMSKHLKQAKFLDDAGRTLATIGEDGKVCVWNLENSSQRVTDHWDGSTPPPTWSDGVTNGDWVQRLLAIHPDSEPTTDLLQQVRQKLREEEIVNWTQELEQELQSLLSSNTVDEQRQNELQQEHLAELDRRKRLPLPALNGGVVDRDNQAIYCWIDNEVVCFDTETYQRRPITNAPLFRSLNDITGLVPFPEQSAMVVSTDDGLEMRHSKDGRPVYNRLFGPKRILGMSLTPQSNRLLQWNGPSEWSGISGFACIWNLNDLKQRSPLFRHADRVLFAELDPTETRMLTISAPTDSAQRRTNGNAGVAQIHVWDVETVEEIIAPIGVGDPSYLRVTFAGSHRHIALYDEMREQGYILAIEPQQFAKRTVQAARLEMVRRTGTYIDGRGELVFLTQAEWGAAKQSAQQYQTWFDTIEMEHLLGGNVAADNAKR